MTVACSYFSLKDYLELNFPKS